MQNINLKCEPGSLTMVVGAVGSGKSSLLATLFQQITRMEGSVKVWHSQGSKSLRGFWEHGVTLRPRHLPFVGCVGTLQ